MFWKDADPNMDDILSQRRPSAADAVANNRRRQSVADHQLTGAATLTTRQSLVPVMLVTTLFFMWGFAYGLLDVLNAHFQDVLGISASQASGLQGAYFG
jgi:MFS transporter, FHS family, L-fucose permease